ncbi:MAG TPA: hypothetical protein VFD26_05080 [Methyloceanibacter sp.]|nr:hypothetical protein [Methyloceanibacter sp.]
MTLKYAVAAALVIGFAGAAVAADGSQFVIIKDKNQHCRVIEQHMVSEDQLGMQIGKQGYPSRDEANIDIKVLCDNS